jgi:hypothetical protein
MHSIELTWWLSELSVFKSKVPLNNHESSNFACSLLQLVPATFAKKKPVPVICFISARTTTTYIRLSVERASLQ